MKSTKLSVSRIELIAALDALSSERRQRFTSVLPVWLHYTPETGELLLQEDKGLVYAHLTAQGDWPPAGATVNLYALRNAAKNFAGADIELHAVAEGVLVPSERGFVKLSLLAFGPPYEQLAPPKGRGLGVEDLPLFRWANTRPSG